MEIEVEPVVRGTNGERRSVGPPLHVDPLAGLVGVPPPRATWSARAPRCPPPRLLADPFGRYAGRAGDGCPLRVTAHTLEHPEHRLRALHFEADFHGPTLLHRRADQL